MPAAHECSLVLHYCEWHGDDLQVHTVHNYIKKTHITKTCYCGKVGYDNLYGGNHNNSPRQQHCPVSTECTHM